MLSTRIKDQALSTDIPGFILRVDYHHRRRCSANHVTIIAPSISELRRILHKMSFERPVAHLERFYLEDHWLSKQVKPPNLKVDQSNPMIGHPLPFGCRGPKFL